MYRVAGININVTEIDNEFFKRRLKEYKTDDKDVRADLEVEIVKSESVSAPEGKIMGKMHEHRYFVKTPDGGYAFYDYIGPLDTVFTSVIMDRDIKHARAEIRGMETVGGYEADVRAFYVLGEIYKLAVLKHGGVIFHSSSISYRGGALAVSAPSGTGKSTHTSLWKKYYKDEVKYINDDMPVVRIKDGVPWLFGSPWSGKSEINANISAPLKGVVFLERAAENSIERLPKDDAILRLLSQAQRSAFPETVDEAIKIIEKIVLTVPVFLLRCTIGKEAVDLVKKSVFE